MWYVIIMAIFLVSSSYGQSLLPQSPQCGTGYQSLDTIMERVKTLMTHVNRLNSYMEKKFPDLKGEIQPSQNNEAAWQTWGPFTSCSQTCAPFNKRLTGTQQRVRTCLFVNKPLASDTPKCAGKTNETRSCRAQTPCIEASEALGGGSGGKSFSDSFVSKNGQIRAFELRCGTYVSTIKMKYGTRWGTLHGFEKDDCRNYYPDWGQLRTYTLNRMEYIIEIRVTYSGYLDSMVVRTNEREFPLCGNERGRKRKTIRGNQLLYISGRSGCLIDELILHWAV